MPRGRAHPVPVTGERVIIHKRFPEPHDVEGEVVDILSVQFTIATDEGGIEFCFFSDDWEYPKRGA